MRRAKKIHAIRWISVLYSVEHALRSASSPVFALSEDALSVVFLSSGSFPAVSHPRLCLLASFGDLIAASGDFVAEMPCAAYVGLVFAWYMHPRRG